MAAKSGSKVVEHVPNVTFPDVKAGHCGAEEDATLQYGNNGIRKIFAIWKTLSGLGHVSDKFKLEMHALIKKTRATENHRGLPRNFPK